ncbi:hypothetical protein ABZV51_35255 [Streptomyces avermitilis]
MFDQRTLGAYVGGLRPLAGLGAGVALGIVLTFGPDPVEFSLDPRGGLFDNELKQMLEFML